MNPRIIMSRICYFLGDWVSKPMVVRDWAWLYPFYSKLMSWSSELDNINAVWSPPLDHSVSVKESS
jgi:hypothetical protein